MTVKRNSVSNNPFTTAEQVFDYLESFTNLERGGYQPREYRLERMQSLVAAFNHPERNFRVLHVAGSKGKGSVCSFAASCFRTAGFLTGTYLSPHVSSYLERIQIPGVDDARIAAEIIAAGERLRSHVRTLRLSEPEQTLPTTFELLTLLAFLVFQAVEVEIGVVEVGLGGRLDATNLVQPETAVITHIELEHTEYLGNTLEAIAREKGGIIKEGVPVVIAPQKPEVERVLRAIASDRGCRVIGAEGVEVIVKHTDLSGNEVTIRFPDGFAVHTHLASPGGIHALNSATAVSAVRVMEPTMSPDAVAAGLAATRIPGRAEVFPGPPPVLLDGAHTPVSVSAVAELARDLVPDETRVLIFGSVAGKKHTQMLEALVPAFDHVIISRPGTFKKSYPRTLHEACLEAGGSCTLREEMDEALALAYSMNPGLIVVTGSFYLVGEARARLLNGGTQNG